MGFYGGNTRNRPHDLMLYTTHKDSQNGNVMLLLWIHVCFTVPLYPN